jgi:hypothetical protein
MVLLAPGSSLGAGAGTIYVYRAATMDTQSIDGLLHSGSAGALAGAKEQAHSELHYGHAEHGWFHSTPGSSLGFMGTKGMSTVLHSWDT